MSKGAFRERKERETNQVEINTNEHGDLFFRGSVLKNLVPIKETTKAGSIPTLSLSQDFEDSLPVSNAFPLAI
jgi:hypothetical protein